MKKQTFKKVEEVLREFPRIQEYVDNLEAEWCIKGKKVWTIRDENRLKTLSKERAVIDNNFDDADDDTKTIIRELYFKKYPRYTLNELVAGNLVHVGRDKAYHLRDNFIKKVASELELFDL